LEYSISNQEEGAREGVEKDMLGARVAEEAVEVGKEKKG